MNETFTDQPTELRKGEEQDIDKLNVYLKNVLGNDSIQSIAQFPSGYSNLTYLIKTQHKEYVLRRPPFGANIKTAHDMGREFKVLNLLKKVYDKVPAPLVYCEDLDVLGAPFYIMERVNGVILRNRVPKGLDLNATTMKSISEACIDNLAVLHALDIDKSGLRELGKPEGYVKRQVEGWVARYYKAETDKIENMDKVAEWLKANMPPDPNPQSLIPNPYSFIHNDYKYDNLILDPSDLSNIIAVLDWEMATVGDPLMDLGTTLGYWAEANDGPYLRVFGLTSLPGNLNREDALQRYAEKSGRDVSGFLFYYVYACFKIGVIAQQIYARFKLGFTKDPRFGALIHSVKECGNNGANAIKYGRISNFY